MDIKSSMASLSNSKAMTEIALLPLLFAYLVTRMSTSEKVSLNKALHFIYWFSRKLDLWFIRMSVVQCVGTRIIYYDQQWSRRSYTGMACTVTGCLLENIVKVFCQKLPKMLCFTLVGLSFLKTFYHHLSSPASSLKF